MHLFCFGFGYTAQALAQQLLAKGWRVTGTSREGTLDDDRFDDVELFSFDGDAPMARAAERLDGVTHLLSSISPDANGDPVVRHHGKDIAALSQHCTWAGYLSTTGVYGDHGGGLVDETTPLSPTLERSRQRVAAESAWRRLCDDHRLPLHIFRLAGIYGPGRNALTQVLSGRARRIVKAGQVFSRIHVGDAAQVLEASMAAPTPGAIYNVCDDEAAPPQDVIAYAVELLGRAPLPDIAFEDADLSEMALSFYRDNKRVSNARIKNDLGVSLLYPDFRAGLTALLKDLPAE